MRAAFFDMDRTLLRIDSGMSWMRFNRRRGELSRLGMARALYWAALYRLAILDLDSLATRLVSDIAGDAESEMIAKCKVWFDSDLSRQIAPAAVRALARHRDGGDRVVLLTGATQYAAEVVGQAVGIDTVLCSRLEVVDGRFTGRFSERCYGLHKLKLAERFADQEGLDLSRSAFYSDSYNDRPMLERVGEAVAVNPDARLRRHATRSGWRVEWWADS